MVNVHYIFDPMCGWCYGATSLIQQLNEMSGVKLHLHPGGMIERSPLSDGFRQHVLQADQRIAQQTGAVFGEGYITKIKSGETVTLDSYVTAQAIIAAQLLGVSPSVMLKSIQQAHYQQGLPVADTDTLALLAQSLDLEPNQWEQAIEQAKAQLPEQLEQTQSLMAQYQLSGFPSIVYEAEGQWRTVSVSHFYNRPQQWADFWKNMTQ